MLTATLRYLGDAAGAFVLLGTTGAWWLRDRFAGRVAMRRTIDAGIVGLAAVTIAIGIALGFQGQYGFFHLYNQTLMDKLEQKLSVCAPKGVIKGGRR